MVLRALSTLWSTVRANVPWSTKACTVWSGMVFTVSEPMSSSTYMRSAYSGFLVDVEAHSGRWRQAPLAARASHRGPRNRSRQSW